MIHDDFARTDRPRPTPRRRPAPKREPDSTGARPAPRRVRRRDADPDAMVPPTRRELERAARRADALTPGLEGTREYVPELPPEPSGIDVDAIVAVRHASLRRLGGIAPVGALLPLEPTPPAADTRARASAAPRSRPRDAPPAEALAGEAALLRGQRRRRPGAAGAGAAGPAAPVARGWFLGEGGDRRNRAISILGVFLILAAVVGGKLAYVQVAQGPALAVQAANEHRSTVSIPAHRGRILDSQGRLLASDIPLYAVYADPGVIPKEQRHADALALAPVLAVGTQRLDDLLNQPGDYVPLLHGVTEEQYQRLRALGIYGVIATPEDRRAYSDSAVAGASLASNLLGYVDHDGHGQYGVESYYQQVLAGQDGSTSSVHDLAGNAITLGGGTDVAARDGSDLRLGLDSRVQYYAEQALAQAVQQSGAESGSVLVMDTTTGSLRAMADVPTYDANSYGVADPATIRDLAIDGFYEPGSTMKTITFAGGLQAGVFKPTDTLNEGVTSVNGFRIQDWDGRQTHGNITFQWVLDDSLNNGAIQVMVRTGKDAYYQNLLKFGIGSPTGVDLAGEQYPTLRPQAQWTDVDYATASFGQQVSVTPIEMLSAVNAIANGGVWVQPHAVDAVVDPANGTETALTASSRRVISTEAAHTLATMMTGVVEDKGASGYLARIPAFKGQIAGKTGTASVPENGHYGQNVIASFVGFLPAEHPRFTMLVIVRKPQHCTVTGDPGGGAAECEGAYVAAPVFRKLAQVMIDDWRITP